MSLLGVKTAVVSLGMSCQSSYQIELHAKLIGRLCGDSAAKASRFPFDNIICPPRSAMRMLCVDRFHPESIDDLTVSGGGGYWGEMDAHYWHECGPIRSSLSLRKIMNPQKSFERLVTKYAHTARKFRQLSKTQRLVFVISNSQNNLDMVARTIGDFDFVLKLNEVDALAERADAYFGRPCEYVIATYSDRATGQSRRSNVSVHHLSPDGSEWRGDPAQWEAVFRHVMAKS